MSFQTTAILRVHQRSKLTFLPLIENDGKNSFSSGNQIQGVLEMLSWSLEQAEVPQLHLGTELLLMNQTSTEIMFP